MEKKCMHASNREEIAESLDRRYNARIGQITAGFSPVSLLLAYTDLFTNLALAPHSQMELAQDAWEQAMDVSANALSYSLGNKIITKVEDIRFQARYKHIGWQKFPYNVFAEAFLRAEDYIQKASCVRSMSKHHQNIVSFCNLLALSSISPENFLLTNPELTEKTVKEGGANFINGFSNLMEDIQRKQNNEKPIETENFTPKKNIAATEGKVVFKNKLFELIQYSPKTPTAYPEPILFIPAWIMKYYILDLSKENSMVRYLVEQGHTVFMISWKNPDESYRNVGFRDYLKDGALKALQVVEEIIPDHKVHAVGYCIGGTLLSMLASYLRNHEKESLKTVTLFAAQVDFTEAGKLMTFIDEPQISYLEDIMYTQGYLKGNQISAAFELLQPRELIWSRIVQNYMLGERSPSFDLMAWDQDTTRLPYRMHSEYLEDLYLNNKLVEGEFEIDDEVLDLGNISAPMFVVGNEHDNIAPWKSVYKIHLFANTEITFVLTNKGHNGGIVSEPGHQKREYRIAIKKADDRYIQPSKWLTLNDSKEGSWWEDWHKWLENHSSEKSSLPSMGAADKGYAPIADAPGQYINEH